MRLISSVVLVLAATSVAREPVADDFEAPAIAPERWRPSGPQTGRAITTTAVPAWHGARCLQIAVEAGDNRMEGRNGSATERFELTLRDTPVKFGEEVWYAFAFRIPADFPRTDTRTLIHQFKENVRPRPAGLSADVKHCQKASPAFALYLREGRELVALATSSVDCDHTRHELGRRGVEPDRWHEVVVRTRPSHGADGMIDVWVNGERLGGYRGVMGYPCHGLGYIDTQPRFGIYRDAHPEVGRAVIYYDAIRFASTREGLRLSPPTATR